MKIAYVALRGVPLSDGIVEYTDGIARRMVAKGHEVTVYTSKRYGNTNGLYDNCYQIRTVPSLKSQACEKISLIFCASVAQMFHEYDIVHFHGESGAIWSFTAPLSGKARISQSHSIDYNRAKFGKFAKVVLRIIEKLSVKSNTPLLVVSNELQKHFWDLYKKESVVIHNAVELVELREPERDILEKYDVDKNGYYLYMARITREKGLHYLIHAFGKLETDKKLVIAGPLDENDPYNKELIELGKKDPRVKFVGFASGKDKETLYQGAYAYCLPSESEGFSMALLEAMSYQKCCIISNIPNNIEATGDCCISFQTKDEESLYGALLLAENHEDLVRKTGADARERLAKNFTWDIVADQVERLYIDTIENYKKRKKTK